MAEGLRKYRVTGSFQDTGRSSPERLLPRNSKGTRASTTKAPPLSLSAQTRQVNRWLCRENPLQVGNRSILPSVTRVFHTNQNLYVYLAYAGKPTGAAGDA